MVRVREGGEDGEGKGAGQAAAFMRGWVQTSRWAKELGMTREVASWGSRMPHLGEVWFTLRGPWVRARPALPRDLSERIRRERARAHGREERMETQRQQRADRGLTDIDSVYAPPTSRATLGEQPVGAR